MNLPIRFTDWIYGLLVGWYPHRFREEFGEEMQFVFRESLRQNASVSLWAQVTLLAREIKDMPGSIMNAYLHEKKGSLGMSTNGRESPVSIWALVGVMLFYLVFGIYELIDFAPVTENSILSVIFPLIFLLILIGPFVVGIFKRLPRWSIVFAGIALAFLSIYFVMPFERLFEPQLMAWSRQVLSPNTLPNRLLWQLFYQGQFWLAIVVTFLLLAGVIALIPPTRSFARRLWQDWTLVSFLFYGASLLIFVIDFDEYRYEGWYKLGSMLAMAAGAVGYLRAGTPHRRTLSLLAGITVCMAIMGVGKYILVPQQDWPVWFGWHPAEGERWFESLRTIATWFWMALFIGLPGLMQGLRKNPPVPVVVEEPAPA